jgi:hypothetical protein
MSKELEAMRERQARQSVAASAPLGRGGYRVYRRETQALKRTGRRQGAY